MPPKRRPEPVAMPEEEDGYGEEDEEEEEEEDEEEISIENEFRPGDTLDEAHWQRRSVTDLVDMMATPFLELNPDYQRDVVWSPDRMTKLINSLICNFYIPPVIFNVKKTVVDGAERYIRVSIDGKQRLSSIREFVKGNIPCTDQKGRRWYFTDNGDGKGLSKRVISERWRCRFLQTEILCAEYAGLEQKQEEDLFSRVQLGVPLTPAEKLKASSGAWQAFAIEIEKRFPELMDTVVNKRGRSFQLVLQILKQLINSDEATPKYSAGASALRGFCERPQLLDDEFKDVAWRVFNTYDEVRRKHSETFRNHNYTHATKYSPIEFVAMAVLIHRHPERNAKLLSGDILALRSHVRMHRQDLRSNTPTWTIFIDWIDNIEIHRGGVDVIAVSKPQNMSLQNAGEGPPAPIPPPSVTHRMARSDPSRRTSLPSAPSRPNGARVLPPSLPPKPMAQASNAVPLPPKPVAPSLNGQPRPRTRGSNSDTTSLPSSTAPQHQSPVRAPVAPTVTFPASQPSTFSANKFRAVTGTYQNSSNPDSTNRWVGSGRDGNNRRHNPGELPHEERYRKRTRLNDGDDGIPIKAETHFGPFTIN